MPVESHQAVEQLVIAFPAAAAWIIVMLVGIIVMGFGVYARKFLKRMDAQDETLNAIRSLLASEVGKLRELHHEIDKRVLLVEGALGLLPGTQRFGRRSTDNPEGGQCD